MAIPPYRFHRLEGRGQAVLRSYIDDSYPGTVVRGGPKEGDASVAVERRSCAFSHLSSSFPLKLLSPRISSRDATNRLHAAAAAAEKAREGATQTRVKAVAALYVVGYGGGLVSGDSVDLDIDVGTGCSLLLLTQGSTKVFQSRQPSGSNTALSPPPPPPPTTRQSFRFLVRRDSTLVLLPDPVTCFSRSRYAQTQRFDLRSARSSSLILLDWLTPGRTQRRSRPVVPSSESAGADISGAGAPQTELWAFDRYASRNEVRVQGCVLARDVLVLEQQQQQQQQRPEHLPNSTSTGPSAHALTPLAERNAPYGCYATLLLVGPDAQPIVRNLSAAYYQIQQGRSTPNTPVQRVLWSLSALDVDEPQARARASASAGADGRDDLVGSSQHEEEMGLDEAPPAAIVRVAGIDTEDVRSWLYGHLEALQSVVGEDLYKQALGP